MDAFLERVRRDGGHYAKLYGPIGVAALGVIQPSPQRWIFIASGGLSFVGLNHYGHRLRLQTTRAILVKARDRWRKWWKHKPEDLKNYAFTCDGVRFKFEAHPPKGKRSSDVPGRVVKKLLQEIQAAGPGTRVAAAGRLRDYLELLGARRCIEDVTDTSVREVMGLFSPELMGLEFNGVTPLADVGLSNFAKMHLVLGDARAAIVTGMVEPKREFLESLCAEGEPVVIEPIRDKPGKIAIRPLPHTPRLLVLEDERRRDKVGPDDILAGRDLITGENRYVHVTKFENHLVTGMLESGKSVWLHSQVLQLTGSKSICHMGIIDKGKRGVEFARYKGPKVTVASSLPEMCALVRNARFEMEDRYAYMVRKDIATFDGPTFLLVVDEWNTVDDFTPETDHIDPKTFANVHDYERAREAVVTQQRTMHAEAMEDTTKYLGVGRAARCRAIGCALNITTTGMSSAHRRNLQQIKVAFKQDEVTLQGLYGPLKGMLIDPVKRLKPGQCVYQNGPRPGFIQGVVPRDIARGMNLK